MTGSAKAKSDDEAKGIAGAIERGQLRSGSDTADLLMSRAMTAIQAGKSEVAVDLLTAIVKIDPDFTEAWNKRATLVFPEERLCALGGRHRGDAEARAAPFRRLVRARHDPARDRRQEARL